MSGSVEPPYQINIAQLQHCRKEPVDGSSRRRGQSRVAIWKSDENLVFKLSSFEDFQAMLVL